ncbi:MAG: regulatory protein RecX [Clostridia bacterium]|nr:regulatory protein RecX [Clostridia bacterium]
MIITKITKSKKGNALIYADNNYLASVPIEVFIKSRLKVGSNIDENTLEELVKEMDFNKAKEKALRLLSLRAHSKKELTDKLKNSSGEESAEKVAEKMQSLGLIDDRSFAVSYASELFSKKLHSVSKVKYELSKKGISNDIIEEIIEEISPDERQNIEKIFEKKHFDINDEKNFRRTVAYCQRLGYSWNDIKSVINLYNQT